MLSIVLEVSVRLRGQLTYFLLRRHEIYKYCFANKGQVDVWIIGRDPVQEVKRKGDHFRKVYEFLYRKDDTEKRCGMSLWCTIERCDDRGSMQEIRERLGIKAEPPMRLVKDAVLNDVMVSGATETVAEMPGLVSDDSAKRTINTSHSQNSDKGESSDETKRRCTEAEVKAEARIIAWVLCQRAKVKRKPENSNELNQCDTV